MPTADESRSAVSSAVAEAIRETGFTPTSNANARLSSAPAVAAPDDDSDPTDEDLARIDRDPAARAAYQSMTRQHRERMARADSTHRELEASRREAEEATKIVDLIRADPEQAMRAMAHAKGLRLEKVKEVTLHDRVQAKLRAALGAEAAAALGPAIAEAVSEVTTHVTRPMLDPLRADYERRQRAEQQAEQQRERDEMNNSAKETIKEFVASVRARGDEWNDEIERAMAIKTRSFTPGPGMRMRDYLDTIYDAVTHERVRTRKSKGPGDATRKITAGMDPREAVRLAVQQARAEARGR
jgi:hypothetical protein